MPENLLKFTPQLKPILSSKKKPTSKSKYLDSLACRRHAARQRWIKPDTPFPVGQKAIYLPNFTVTLLRTPFHPPTLARFRVPLSFTKLDLRDYLFHAYSVPTLNIRSVVKYTAQRPPEEEWLKRKRRYQPQCRKYMTAELAEPFVWPEEPTAEEKEEMLERRTAGLVNAAQTLTNREMVQRKEEVRRKRVARLRQMAELLLSGRLRWGAKGQAEAGALLQEVEKRREGGRGGSKWQGPPPLEAKDKTPDDPGLTAIPA